MRSDERARENVARRPDGEMSAMGCAYVQSRRQDPRGLLAEGEPPNGIEGRRYATVDKQSLLPDKQR